VASRVLLARPGSRPAAVPTARSSARPRRRRPDAAASAGKREGLGSKEAICYLTRHGNARINRLVLIAPTTLLRRTADNPAARTPR
jgi:hypothetical protein